MCRFKERTVVEGRLKERTVAEISAELNRMAKPEIPEKAEDDSIMGRSRRRVQALLAKPQTPDTFGRYQDLTKAIEEAESRIVELHLNIHAEEQAIAWLLELHERRAPKA